MGVDSNRRRWPLLCGTDGGPDCVDAVKSDDLPSHVKRAIAEAETKFIAENGRRPTVRDVYNKQTEALDQVFALPHAKGRIREQKMNKTEARYAEHLERLKLAGEILWYQYEAVTLKLADDTRYTPDFMVLLANGELEAHEVKGFWRDDARVKIKVAARLFPFRFIAVSMPKGGIWVTESF